MKRALVIDAACGCACTAATHVRRLVAALRAAGWITAVLAPTAPPAASPAAAAAAPVSGLPAVDGGGDGGGGGNDNSSDDDCQRLPLCGANVLAALLWLTDVTPDVDSSLLYVHGAVDGAALTLVVDGAPLALPPLLLPRLPPSTPFALLVDACPPTILAPAALPAPTVGMLTPPRGAPPAAMVQRLVRVLDACRANGGAPPSTLAALVTLLNAQDAADGVAYEAPWTASDGATAAAAAAAAAARS